MRHAGTILTARTVKTLHIRLIFQCGFAEGGICEQCACQIYGICQIVFNQITGEGYIQDPVYAGQRNAVLKMFVETYTQGAEAVVGLTVLRYGRIFPFDPGGYLKIIASGFHSKGVYIRRYGLTEKQKKILMQFGITESYLNKLTKEVNKRF